jgi:hypothetical protein
MGLDVWFREDVTRILQAVILARGILTTDEQTILQAVAAGFGIELTEILCNRNEPLKLREKGNNGNGNNWWE